MITDMFELSDERAIELSKRAIAPCKGITLRALSRTIELAEKYILMKENIKDDSEGTKCYNEQNTK